jgi:hypothetical protein
MAVGSAHHAAKITEDDVRRMRAAHAGGKSIDDVWSEIARPLGLSRSSTDKIIYRMSWKHVE